VAREQEMKESDSVVSVAAVQMAPRLGELAGNRREILRWLHEAAGGGANLIVFPECALGGYVFESREEARGASEPIPGPTSAALTAACADLDVYAAVGMLETAGEALHNTLLLVGPDGPLAAYRKTHLPVLGVDRFVQPGDTLEVVETPVGILGPLVCYDLRFPEAPRVLALKGAEIIVHGTNWPRASADFPDFVTKAAARASGVFLVTADRVGEERGMTFLGRSQIIAPDGHPLQEADDHSETILVARLDLALARQKRVVHIPGRFELDSFGDRRPELYGRLVVRDR
jgi:predicted amidohydrolase